MVNVNLSKHELWSLINLVFRIGSKGTVLLLSTFFLNAEELKFWYLMLATYGIFALIENSLRPTVLRILSKESSNLPKRGKWIKSLNLLYLTLAIFIVAGMGIGGTYIVSSDTSYKSSSWSLFVLATSLLTISGYYSAALAAGNLLYKTQKIEIISAVVSLIVLAIGLRISQGVSHLLFSVYLLSFSFCQAALNYLLFSKETKQNQSESPYLKITLHRLKFIFLDAWPMIPSMVGYILLSSYFFIIITKYETSYISALFGVVSQALTLAMTCTGVWVSASAAEIARIKNCTLFERKKKLSDITTKTTISIVLLVPIAVVLSACIFFYSNEIKTDVLRLLLLVIAVYMLEAVYSSKAQILIYAGYQALTSRVTVAFSVMFALVATALCNMDIGNLEIILVARVAIFGIFYVPPIQNKFEKLKNG